MAPPWLGAEDDYWDDEQVAAFLGVATTTVHEHISNNRIPPPIFGFSTPIWKATVVREWWHATHHPRHEDETDRA